MRAFSFSHRQQRTEHATGQRKAEYAQDGAAVKFSSDQKTRQQKDRAQAKRRDQTASKTLFFFKRCCRRSRSDGRKETDERAGVSQGR